MLIPNPTESARGGDHETSLSLLKRKSTPDSSLGKQAATTESEMGTLGYACPVS